MSGWITSLTIKWKCCCID